MSEQTKRQAYVFLQEREPLQKGDQFYDSEVVVWRNILECDYGHEYSSSVHGTMRRPIATPEQTDGLTIEQRVTELEMQLKRIQPIKLTDTQPAEQPSETCKWKKTHRSHDSIYDPHGHGPFGMCMKYCPFCGKKIEVVE
jgi:hypothetical protein